MLLSNKFNSISVNGVDFIGLMVFLTHFCHKIFIEECHQWHCIHAFSGSITNFLIPKNEQITLAL